MRALTPIIHHKFQEMLHWSTLGLNLKDYAGYDFFRDCVDGLGPS